MEKSQRELPCKLLNPLVIFFKPGKVYPMKPRAFSLFFFVLFAFIFPKTLFSPVWAEELAVDGFQDSSVGEFPASWKTYPFQGGKAKRVYKIEQEGSSKFLRAVDDEQLSITIL